MHRCAFFTLSNSNFLLKVKLFEGLLTVQNHAVLQNLFLVGAAVFVQKARPKCAHSLGGGALARGGRKGVRIACFHAAAERGGFPPRRAGRAAAPGMHGGTHEGRKWSQGNLGW